MKRLKLEEKKFWQAYLRHAHINEKDQIFNVEASPAGNFLITDPLIELYLQKKKTAGSSIKEDFESAGDPLPKIGNYWIALNSLKKPCLILKTVNVEYNKFFEVPESVARAEGEGDLSLEYWRRVHSNIYIPHLQRWGLKDISEATVVTEHFEEVYRTQENAKK